MSVTKKHTSEPVTDNLLEADKSPEDSGTTRSSAAHLIKRLSPRLTGERLPEGRRRFLPGQGVGWQCPWRVTGPPKAWGLREQSWGAAPPWGPQASRTGRRSRWNRVVRLHHTGLCGATRRPQAPTHWHWFWVSWRRPGYRSEGGEALGTLWADPGVRRPVEHPMGKGSAALTCRPAESGFLRTGLESVTHFLTG